MNAIITCLDQFHDWRLLIASCFICVIGVYAAFALGMHAARSEGVARRNWAITSMIAAGSTAWATHMIALLAYRPGLPAVFDVPLTALSLLIVTAGIALSMTYTIASRDRRRRFISGILLGVSVAVLHYLGQFSYKVAATVFWDLPLVFGSIGASLLMFGAGMVASGERSRSLRRLAPPLLLAAISVVHVGGMTAMTLLYDPFATLPALAVPPQVIAPVIAAVCLCLIALAVYGLRVSLRAQAQLRRDRVRLGELSNLAVEGLVVCDGDTITIVNDSFARLAGVARSDVIGETVGSLIPSVTWFDMVEREEYDAELVGAAGRLIPVRVLRSEVTVGSKRQIVFAVRDQRERLKTEEAIRRLAYTDALTGLTNRMRFSEILAVRAANLGEGVSQYALLAIDLDRFKWVNDTFGHSFGDELLRQVAERLGASTGGDDVVARLGGDEFSILTAGDADRVTSLAAGIVDTMRSPFSLGAQIIEIGASIGIAYLGKDGADADAVARNADLALYSAKHSGRERYCLYEPKMLAEALNRSELERDLRLALKRDELEVHFQPLTDASSGAFQGAEALLRWTHPKRGMISPAEFIPLAEEIGLIGAIGEWVLRTACVEAAGWPETTSLAVNLSAVELGDPNLVKNVAKILKETGFPATRLELEVTETALLRDDVRTFGNLHGLKDLGIRISLDDFGTGYSSLSHLRRFPFDKVKIDRFFVRQIPEDPDSVAIVQAIVTLAAKMRMSVTIEGVETVEQQEFARHEGCNQIQGFLISRPIPGVELAPFFANPDRKKLSA
ncbi:EAL domain-containing protein [Palleronia sp.]|uniref:bifunctional diguanylate cyclase/phosphodiesterase n=1 Tax=Palleronia sp. TaxID=1940284 RepID=UPI0035C7E578